MKSKFIIPVFNNKLENILLLYIPLAQLIHVLHFSLQLMVNYALYISQCKLCYYSIFNAH